MITIQVPGHLLIPFGRPKWTIENIRIAGVSTKATYFESDTPCAYIDTTKRKALRLMDFVLVNPTENPTITDTTEALNFIHNWIKTNCELGTDSEKRFLDLYFDYFRTSLEYDEDWHQWYHKNQKRLENYKRNDPDWNFLALLPLPQAHLYLEDPLQDSPVVLGHFPFIPKNMVKVDFAFWTGQQLVAIEIDGSSHIGSQSHIRKDRMLQRAGVMVIHILNSEILEHQQNIIWKLLPKSVVNFWESLEDNEYPWNPFIVPYQYLYQ